MRWFVLFGLACCSDRSAPADNSAYVYRFIVDPTGNSGPMFEPGVQNDYEFRAEGECFGRRVDGTPFSPRHAGTQVVPGIADGKPLTILVAPTDHIAIGVVVKHGGRELLHGCKAV